MTNGIRANPLVGTIGTMVMTSQVGISVVGTSLHGVGMTITETKTGQTRGVGMKTTEARTNMEGRIKKPGMKVTEAMTRQAGTEAIMAGVGLIGTAVVAKIKEHRAGAGVIGTMTLRHRIMAV